jgi:flagellar motor switch protein FliM
MTREELLQRLTQAKVKLAHERRNVHDMKNTERLLASLIEDVQEDGVLDVQAPHDIADSMNLPNVDKATSAKTVARLRALLINNGLTASELSRCTVGDIIALHESMTNG